MNHWLASAHAFAVPPAKLFTINVLAAGDSSGTALLVLAITAVILVLVFAYVGHLKKLDRKDLEKLSAAGTALGFTFRPIASSADETFIANSHLGTLGRRRAMTNVFERNTSTAGRETVFNFHFTTSAGKNASWTTQTVMQMQLPAVSLPPFLLEPTSGVAAASRQSSPVGNVIDVGASPKFKELFAVRGTDEAGIRRVFTPAVIEACERRAQLVMEGSASGLFLYEKGRRIKPEEFEAFVNEGTRMRSLLETGESRGGGAST